MKSYHLALARCSPKAEVVSSNLAGCASFPLTPSSKVLTGSEGRSKLASTAMVLWNLPERPGHTLQLDHVIDEFDRIPEMRDG